MNLHYETVSPLLKETLQKLVNSPIFKDFTLIGGTCLSLQLGHRRSIDIDLFTDIDYGTMNTKEMKEFIPQSIISLNEYFSFSSWISQKSFCLGSSSVMADSFMAAISRMSAIRIWSISCMGKINFSV